MGISGDAQKKLHHDLSNVGLRAQATSAGLVQLCVELRRAKLLDEAAIDRIKGAILEEVILCTPRTVASRDYRREMRHRLDRVFAGEESIGSADALAGPG